MPACAFAVRRRIRRTFGHQRDYTLALAANAGEAPLLSVFGGKLTTYRKLAEAALNLTGALSRHAR